MASLRSVGLGAGEERWGRGAKYSAVAGSKEKGLWTAQTSMNLSATCRWNLIRGRKKWR